MDDGMVLCQLWLELKSNGHGMAFINFDLVIMSRRE